MLNSLRILARMPSLSPAKRGSSSLYALPAKELALKLRNSMTSSTSCLSSGRLSCRNSSTRFFSSLFATVGSNGLRQTNRVVLAGGGALSSWTHWSSRRPGRPPTR